MQYLMLIRLDPSLAPTDGPDDKLMEEMGVLMDEMTKAGVLVNTAGLRPIEEATRVRQRRGRQKIVDGPFAESKEVIGGFCLLETASKEEAVEWTSRFLAIHGPEWDVEVEVRQLDQG
ncbi:YciI family protein [Smaragdicoccus niigatensis]|uniref:YciI family protein n=1 Tax=Smaragdicoccus niigatensis TaxID=359359 RepID=UPI00037F10E0|nr:YciI family protein [Smaragdicoccus niigatensis]